MRTESREICLQILFQSEFSSKISNADYLGLLEEKVDKDTLDYAETLVEGIRKHRTEIDELIQSLSAHWSLARMSTVDRNVLRIGVFEMKFAQPSLKPNIAINEAIEIAKRYGSTESASFVNGILDAVAKGL